MRMLGVRLGMFVPALYLFTMYWYGVQAWFDPSRSVAILTPNAYFAASSYFDILCLDLMGIYLWRKIGAVKSLLFLIMTGAIDLYTWAFPHWFAFSLASVTIATLSTLHNQVFTLLWLVAAPAIMVYMRKRIDWRLNWLFFPFLAYMVVYFNVLGAPFAGGTGNTPWELLYEGLANLALLSGFFRRWRVWK